MPVFTGSVGYRFWCGLQKITIDTAFIRHKQLAARRAELFQEMLD
jgi:hypothetical protein